MQVRSKSPSRDVQHTHQPPHAGETHTQTTASPSHDELVKLVEQAKHADDLEKLLHWVDTNTLRNSPYLLHTLARQFVPLTQHHPELLKHFAVRCLEAVRGAPLAQDIWVHLSQQLQREDLPLPAARCLQGCMEAAQKDLPDGKATAQYIEARVHMSTRENKHARENAQRAYQRQLEQQLSVTFAHTRVRAHSLPSFPSQ